MRFEAKDYKIPALVGGARKTCVVKPEGFPKLARDLAEYYVETRRERFLPALKAGRDGYLMKNGREYVTFNLVDNVEQMEANILAAIHNFARDIFTVRSPRVLPRGVAQMLAG